jgi:hypothetical protein
VRLWSAYPKTFCLCHGAKKVDYFIELLVPSVALYRCSSAELAPPNKALVVGSTGAAGVAVATAGEGAITVGAGDRL